MDGSSNRILHRHRPAASGRAGETADAFYLDRAIDLAWLGAGKTLTNPMVGAVVVKEGCVVAEGYHEAYGLDHAETSALDRAGQRAVGATLYATLEPCTHHGKTPPCVDRIVDSGVSRVVVCTLDPDPRMDGKGMEALRMQGIEVEVGCRAERALMLNLAYFKRIMTLGCAVTLKMAMTLDGCIASAAGRADTITGWEARRQAHRFRAVNLGVLVGIDTILIDAPRLDCRLLDGVKSPVPVVLDTRLRFPDRYPWIAEGREFLIVTGPNPDPDKVRKLEQARGEVIRCELSGGRVDIACAMELVAKRGISSVLIEGGAKVLASFLAPGLWDGLHLFMSPTLFGPEGVNLVGERVDVGESFLANVGQVSGDVLTSYLNAKTRATMLERLLWG